MAAHSSGISRTRDAQSPEVEDLPSSYAVPTGAVDERAESINNNSRAPVHSKGHDREGVEASEHVPESNSVIQESPTLDESNSISTGVETNATGDFRGNAGGVHTPVSASVEADSAIPPTGQAKDGRRYGPPRGSWLCCQCNQVNLPANTSRCPMDGHYKCHYCYRY